METRILIKRLVEQCLVTGLTNRKIVDVVQSEYPYATAHTIKNLIEEIGLDWAKEEEFRRPMNKQAAVQRIIGHIMKCRDAKDWANVARFENLLADMQGTKEAVTINVNMTVTGALMNVIGGMSNEQMQDALNHIIELEKKANAIETSGNEATPVLSQHQTDPEEQDP